MGSVHETSSIPLTVTEYCPFGVVTPISWRRVQGMRQSNYTVGTVVAGAGF